MRYKVHLVRAVFLLAGITSLLVGVASGQAGQAWMKAINICLECIGIG